MRSHYSELSHPPSFPWIRIVFQISLVFDDNDKL